MPVIIRDTNKEMLREPTHYSIYIKEYMKWFKLLKKQTAVLLNIGKKELKDIMSKKRSITNLIALKLSRLFNTTPDFWINANSSYELWHLRKKHKKMLEKIISLRTKKSNKSNKRK